MIESFGKFMYRIPGFSFTTFQKDCGREDIDNFLKEFFSNEKFLSAVRLASKDFYDEIIRFQEGYDFAKKDLRKFRETAIKYISRMCCRSTPFGLFSGCGIGSVGGSEDTIQPFETLGSKVRLDMGFLTSVAEYLAGNEKVRKHLKFFKNNTTYKLGNKYRYVEYKVANGERLYNLSSVEENEVLEEIMEMAKDGCYFNDIVQHLQNDFTVEEIQPYFNELVDSKILISELEPVMTGIEYEEQFIDIIGQIAGRGIEEDVKALLNHVQEILGSYKKIVNDLESNRRSLTGGELSQLTTILKELPNKYNVKDLIQTDCFSDNHAAHISEQTLKEVIEGIEVITRMANVPKSRIDDFKSAFYKRYDNQIVPLSEVMDPEAGIGYGTANNEFLDFTPFVDSMPKGRGKRKSGGESQMNWRSEVHGLLYNKIKNFSKAEQPDAPGIQLTAADLESLPKNITKLPPTFNAVMCLYQEDTGKRWIEFKKVGSTSATCLLGRFGYLTEGAGGLLNDIAAHESHFYENKIVAEINHLSDIRVGNVMQRPRMREFEIAYLTKSNSTEKGIIDLSDLYLMYRNGNLILFSRSLGKQVVPRLSNAHNYYKDTLPVYKFLSDLQEFEVGGGYISVGIDIGPMNNFFDHIPRITYKNCILHLAHWYIKSSEFKRMLGEKEADLDLQEKFISFFEKKNIPTKFLFVEGDYDIFVDLNNFLSFGNFIRDIKNKTLVVIKEALIVEGKALVKNSTGQYFHEIIMPLKHMQTNENKASDISVIDKAIATLNKAKGAVVKRSFSPGEEWLYFKIYAGVKVCDELVKTDLYEIVTHLKETGLISKWFFIRYNDDGGYHLRVRLLLTDVKHCGEIMIRFSKVLESKIRNGVVKNLNIDTYDRELERYGQALISPAESIFGLDSDFCMQTLRAIKLIGQDEYRWLFCLATMYAYFDAFKFTEKRIYSFSKLARDNFGEEFNADKMQKRYFITKYGSLKSQLDAFFTEKRIGEESQEWFFAQLKKFETRLSEMYETFYSELRPEEAENYLRSFIHMSIVRFFSSKNRMHEYALYCLIEQHFKYKLSKEEHLSKAKAGVVAS